MAVATDTVPPGPRNLWIVSPWADTLFVIGAPLLIAPIFYLAAKALSPTLVAGFVFGVLSTGHHLPGFLRAYGDPVLFSRYRLRFLAMPPLVFLAIFAFTWNEMHGAAALIAIWSVWHGFMQVYGFMRIYDAKRGENSPVTRRLDWLVCAISFVTILLWSDGAAPWVLEPAEGAGLYFLPLLFGDTMQTFMGVLAGVTACVYVGYTAWSFSRGRPIAPLKLIFLGISIVFLYFSWVLAGSAVLLGLAAWEAFHDVQYLAIVWANNRRLVAQGGAGRSLRPLFRGSAWLAAVYIGLCLAYGAALNSQQYFASHLIVSLLVALGLTSTLLHFYFDGFIWKVRQNKTRQDLGIPVSEFRGTPAAAPRQPIRHRDWPQFAYVGVPLALLAVIGVYRVEIEIPVLEAVVRIAPGSAQQRARLGAAYLRERRWSEAIVEYRAALEIDPAIGSAYQGLGTALARRGNVPEAMTALRDGLAADPAHTDSALRLSHLLVRRKRPLEAAEVLRGTLTRAADGSQIPASRWFSESWSGQPLERAPLEIALAQALLAAPPDDDRIQEAMFWAQQAVQHTDFREAKPLMTLAGAMAAQERWRVAVRLLERAQRIARSEDDPQLIGEIERSLIRYRARLGEGQPGTAARLRPSSRRG
jgi:tetratricopeptide (TPR) repeat protein